MQIRVLLRVTETFGSTFTVEDCGLLLEEYDVSIEDLPAELREKIIPGIYLVAKATLCEPVDENSPPAFSDFTLAPEPDPDDGLA